MKLVVFSIDKYSRIGPMFWQYLEAHWPAHFDTIFIANHLPINVPAPVVSVPGIEMNFGGRMRDFLRDHYTEDYLMLMMIDYIPKSSNDSLLKKSAEIIKRKDIGHIRLRPMPAPATNWNPDKDFGIIDKHKPYSLSLQPGIWESQLLFDLCRGGENAWHMETHGSTRTHRYPQTFLCTWEAAIYHHNYYIKGKICPIPSDAPWRIRGRARDGSS